VLLLLQCIRPAAISGEDFAQDRSQNQNVKSGSTTPLSLQQWHNAPVQIERTPRR